MADEMLPPFAAFGSLEGGAKDEMIISLVSIILNECGKDFSAEKYDAVLAAAGCKVSPYWTKAFSAALSKSGAKGCDDFFAQPGGGGGGGGGGGDGGGGGAAAAALVEAKKEEEEEEEVDMGGGMDMFGGEPSGGGGGDY